MPKDHRSVLVEALAMFEKSLARTNEILSAPNKLPAQHISAIEESRDCDLKQINKLRAAIETFDALDQTH